MPQQRRRYCIPRSDGYGVWKTVAGVVLVGVGVACIIATAGAGAQKYTTDLTGNQTAGMIAGMAASMATAKGLNGIEAGAKKLAKPKLGDVELTVAQY